MKEWWFVRHRRAQELAMTKPHAAEFLRFYTHILVAQRTVYEQSGGVAQLPNSPQGESLAKWRVSLLRADELAGDFFGFVNAICDHAPAITAELGRQIVRNETVNLIDWFTGGPDSIPTGFEEFTHLQLRFYPLAFVQPLAQRHADSIVRDRLAAGVTVCPVCDGPPLVSVLQDEPDAKGQRRLVCSVCSARWRYPRIQCPRCRETSSDKLIRHQDESMPHVSVDECTSCHHYIKTVDARTDGRADPYADDIGSVELDLWAGERNMTKIEPNLLGF